MSDNNNLSLRIDENQSDYKIIRWDEIVTDIIECKEGSVQVYRNLTDEEKKRFPGQIVIRDYVKKAENITFQDFKFIRDILDKKQYKISQYPHIKFLHMVNIKRPDIYIQLITPYSSYSIIFRLDRKSSESITDFNQLNDLDDNLTGTICIQDDINFVSFDSPCYYEEVDKNIIIKDIVKWIDECLEEFRKL